MIIIDYTKLEAYKFALNQLAGKTTSISDPLTASRGKATEKEKEIIDLLLEICNTDLPALFSSSALLLDAIKEEFLKAEQEAMTLY